MFESGPYLKMQVQNLGFPPPKVYKTLKLPTFAWFYDNIAA